MEQRPKAYKPIQLADLLHSHANIPLVKEGERRGGFIPFSVTLPDGKILNFETKGSNIFPVTSERQKIPFGSISEAQYNTIPECDRHRYRLA